MGRRRSRGSRTSWLGFSKGQAAVEFALGSIVLILLMGGVLDLGRAYFFSITMHNAAREGSRHGAWFDETQRANPYLDEADIKSAVDQTLQAAQLPASVLQSGCPATADGNTDDDPPYVSAAYPTTVNAVYLYICYQQGNVVLNPINDPGPDDSSYWLQDLNVIVLLSYGLISGALQPQIGNGIHIAANFTMAVQGHP